MSFLAELASSFDDNEKTKLLVLQGADLDLIDPRDLASSALIQALHAGNQDIVNFFLEKNINFNRMRGNPLRSGGG